ncbi:hypothetical protein [Actinomadura chokoriensis]|uniref:hypothetical protein n=1 Tax=Actinomadura chokoriensis TaxID=454156 RepID=UPI0031F7E4B2
MGRVRTAGSGLEEWACPSCGRRILLRWPPHYVKHVLDHGDEEACHIARITDDTATDQPDRTDRTDEDDRTDRTDEDDRDAAGTRRWLRETGATTLHTSASGLNPAEPV